MRRHVSLSVFLILLLTWTGLAMAQQSTSPMITLFTTSLKGVDRTALSQRTARIPVSWATSNRPVLANLVFEQILPDNTIINVELPRAFPWVNSSGDGVAAPILPATSTTQIRLRVRLVNVITQATLDTKEITLPITQDGSGSSPTPGRVPRITAFSSSFVGKLNRSELSAGSARIPVAWAAADRPITATLVFEQVMADGSLVNVELPRSTPWVNSSDKGMVAPRLPHESATDVLLRLRLIDLVYGRILDQREIAVPIDTGITLPPVITTFTTPRSSVTLEELRATLRLAVTWDVTNRPANTNLVFEQVMANNQIRNAELPRDFTIVPSSGQGMVMLVDPGAAAEVLIRVRLMDLGSGTTLVTREIRLPIANASTGYTVVTGEACYQAPFPPSRGLVVGQTGVVLSFYNDSVVLMNKEKAPDFTQIADLKTKDTFKVLEGPYCVMNGPDVNFRQWKVQPTTGTLTGWVSEYNGGANQGFVHYIAGGVVPADTKPELVTFSVQPADKLDFNGTVTVTWEVRNASRVLLYLGSKSLLDQAAKGTLTFNVKEVYNGNPTLFSLAAYDKQGNSVDQQKTVPVDTVGITINSFTVAPTSVQQGAPVTVTWDIGGPFARAGIMYDKIENQMPVTDLEVTTPTGQGTITVGTSVSNRVHTFTLWVEDTNGVTIKQDVTVTVTCANTTFFISDPVHQDGRCATPVRSIPAAYQSFSGGFMLWLNMGDYNEIVVFYNTGTYAHFGDWDGTSYQITDAPTDVLLPSNGFGYVWNANAAVRTGLGYPTSAEQGYTATLQSTATFYKYDTTYQYITLPDGRTVRLTRGVNGGSVWGFAG